MYIRIKPVPKPRMTRADKWKKRPSVVAYREFADELRLKFKGEVPEKIRIIFHMPMPKSWSFKKRVAHLDEPHQQKPDIDNLVKAVLDALCEDDSFVYSVYATKVWDKEAGIDIYEIS